MSQGDRQSSETTIFVSQLTPAEPGKRATDNSKSDPDQPWTAGVEQPVCIAGRYYLFEEIARGGMGEIVRACDRILNRSVAIKVLQRRHQADPLLHRRFLEEGQIMGDLQHPGIAPIFDVGEFEDGRPFFAMKLLNGHSLCGLLSQRKHSREELARNLRVLEHVSQTIAYSHTRRIVHRDLKPHNIMVGVFGEVIVLDWGLAKRLGPTQPSAWRGDDIDGRESSSTTDDTLLTMRLNESQEGVDTKSRWGEILGTIEYLAPEQLIDAKCHGDEQTDVFGLGAILCEILTGKPPYWQEKREETLRLALAAELEPARERLRHCGLPREMVHLALDCLQSDPQQRPPNAGTVANMLARYLESSIRAAESDLARFFEFSQDLFCIAGLDGHFRRVNSNFARVLGYSEELLLAHPFMEFVHPDDHRATQMAVEQLAANTPIVAFRNRYRDAGGQYRVLEWSAKSIPEEGVIFAVARELHPHPELVTDPPLDQPPDFGSRPEQRGLKGARTKGT